MTLSTRNLDDPDFLSQLSYIAEPLERRVLLSNTLISGASSTAAGSTYTLHLNTQSQSSATWSVNWGDGSA